MRRTRKTTIVAALAAAISMIMANVAFADILHVNDLVTAGASASKEPGGTGSLQVHIEQTNSTTTDPDAQGCNAGPNDLVSVTLASSNTNLVTITGNATQTFDGCGSNKSKTYAYAVDSNALNGQSAVISGSVSGGKSGSGWNTTDTFTVNVVVNDPCASVSDPVVPVFSAGSADGLSGWFVTIPSAAATSATSGATISYSTDGGVTFGSVPTLGQGTTTVIAKATTATCNKTSAASREFKVDTIAPSVNPNSVTNSTWRNTSLAQTFTAEDNGSGLASSADASFTLTASAESVNSTTPTVASKTVSDVAGNSTTRTVSALIDRTVPVISASDVNDTTWRNTPLTHSFTASDALSGLASSTDASFNLTASAESANATTPTTVSKTVADVAGNSSTRSVSALIDLTKPTSEVAGVTEGAVYFAAPTVTCPANDSLSGVASAGTPSGNTTTAGPKSVTCNGAVDNAGNVQTVASPAVNYILAPIGTFNSNFDGSAVLKVKPNQAIPLKWAFSDGTTNYAALSTASLSSVSSTRCSDMTGTDGSEVASETASGASGLQLLPDNSYQMNWKASSTTGCRGLTLTMNFSAGGSSSRTILVNITK